MKFKETEFPELVLIELETYQDDRGFFREVYKESPNRLIPAFYVQDNESFSIKGVLRGLHFQKSPAGQGKLVRIISGRAQDIVVDLRKYSPTYGKHLSVILDGSNMMYVPPGFAHGFLALEDTYFHYKCTSLYNKEMESGIIWNDPDLNLPWLLSWATPIVSDKDQKLPKFKDAGLV